MVSPPPFPILGVLAAEAEQVKEQGALFPTKSFQEVVLLFSRFCPYCAIVPGMVVKTPSKYPSSQVLDGDT